MIQNNLFVFYKKYYNLDCINFNISKKKYAFLIYDNKEYYYVDNNSLVEIDEISNIIDLIDDFQNYYNINIQNYYPVCFSNDSLIIALKINNSDNTVLKKIEINKRYSKLIEYHKELIKDKRVSNNVSKEIQMSKKYICRYKIHENFIKKYILTSKRRKKKEFRQLLENIIPNGNSIIDVSCGDNTDALDIAKIKKYDVIVGNDICFNYFNRYEKDVIFTNEDIENNNFRSNIFDVSFCKNTLHHMSSVESINNLLKFMMNISNKIIIVEIEDPRSTGGFPKFLNKYLYNIFLKDVGECYLSKSEFRKLIDNMFSEKFIIKYDEFSNVLGNFMVAVINRR